MRKKIVFIILGLVAIVAFGSGGYVLANNNQIPAVAQKKVSQENTSDLYKQCLESMPKNTADIESWHNSPEHQKLHQEMMANNPDMPAMHQQMMGATGDMHAIHNSHHGIQS